MPYLVLTSTQARDSLVDLLPSIHESTEKFLSISTLTRFCGKAQVKPPHGGVRRKPNRRPTSKEGNVHWSDGSIRRIHRS